MLLNCQYAIFRTFNNQGFTDNIASFLKGTTVYMKKISSLLSKIRKIHCKKAFYGLFSAAIVFAAGCISSQQPELFNVQWKPVGEAPEGVYLLFTSDKRRVVGCCGSNRFFGPVKVEDGQKLSIGMLGATRMATPHIRYEQKFLDDLQAVKSYRFESDGTLTLLDVDKVPCMRLKSLPSVKGKNKR